MSKLIEHKNISEWADDEPIPDPPRLCRTYKAQCPIMCNLSWTSTKDEFKRNVWHPECRRSLYLVQKCYRQKVRLSKLNKITQVLLKKISQIKLTSFIGLIYKFL